VIVKGCSVDNKIGFQPFREKFLGHIVFVNTMTGGLRPAREATDAIFDVFLAQVHDIDRSSGIAHPLYKMIKHEFGFALTPNTRTGVNGKYFHSVLL
jgi:hypothetical protein